MLVTLGEFEGFESIFRGTRLFDHLVPSVGTHSSNVVAEVHDNDKVSEGIVAFFFDKVAEVIKNEDRPLLIFPQGTRLQVDEKRPFKKGVGRIYETLNISCVPIALNSGSVWPKKGIIKYPGKITISFLEPIKSGLKRDDFIKSLEKKIYDEIKNIS